MAIEDVMAALVAILKADSGVSGLVGTRVFGGEMRKDEADDMPRKTIVIRYAGSGGLEANGIVQLQHPRVDVLCYGETFFEADRVRRAVFNVMRETQRKSQGTTLIHAMTHSGGPTPVHDRDTDWRFIFESWLVVASTEAIA